MIEIKPSKMSDIAILYPDGLPLTLRSWTVFYNGKIAGVAGVILKPSLHTVFMKMIDGDYSPRCIYVTAKEIMSLISSQYSNLYAMREKDNSKSASFLSHLGFVYDRDDGSLEVWKWQTQ